MSALPENPDLAWDLDDFTDRERAMEFVAQFETTMCVYSPSVQQLYTNYRMYFPEEWKRKMVILPDPHAYHDTFFHIAPESVLATGVYIIPGGLIGKPGLYLANMQKNRTLGSRQVPFEAGMRTILGSRPGDDAFLPVLTKGDLRSLERSWPVLHLHRIRSNVLQRFSALDLASLESIITEKLESLFQNRQRSGQPA